MTSTQLQLSATLEYDSLIYSEARDIFAMASIKAPLHTSSDRESRAPIDIVCVIDKSGSMDGAKLELVRATLAFMVDQLKEEDKLSVVEFESNVSTSLPLTTMSKDGKKEAKKVIQGIRIGNSTNLSGGLFEGLEVLRNRADPRDVSSILLFTDGQANVGIIDPQSIVLGVEKYVRSMQKAVTIYTFGFGDDHNANMLRAISESGQGLYYYLQEQDEIPQSFGDCLGGLLSVFAQNIKLIIEPFPNILIKAVHSSYKKIVDTPQCVELSIGDLYSEEQRDIVVELSLNLVNEFTCQDVVTFTVSYFNVIATEIDSIKVTARISRTDKESLSQENIEIDKHRNRVKTINSIKTSRERADSGNLDGAREILQQQLKSMQNSVSCQEPLTSSLIDDVCEVMNGMRDRYSYKSAGSKLANSHWAKNHRQRCNESLTKYQKKRRTVDSTFDISQQQTTSPYMTQKKIELQRQAQSLVQISPSPIDHHTPFQFLTPQPRNDNFFGTPSPVRQVLFGNDQLQQQETEDKQPK